MERPIDFSRDRRMLCGRCSHEFVVGLDWIERWQEAKETCPGCGLTCEHEDSPRVTVDLEDPALDDERVAQFFWYHTSTQPDWPTKDFNPEAELSPEVRKTMGGDQRVAAWAEGERAKALHVGTYEAAIHNMLRRIQDQADAGRQFYLYRVHLRPSVVVRPDWIPDPGGLVGDVPLGKVCPPGVNAARYLNVHEDPGSLSLALGREAIASVQRAAVPLNEAQDTEWVIEVIAALERTSDVLVPDTGQLRRFSRPSSPRARLAYELAAELTETLPVNLRMQFGSAVHFEEGDRPEDWALRTSGLAGLVRDPRRMLLALDEAVHRQICNLADTEALSRPRG